MANKSVQLRRKARVALFCDCRHVRQDRREQEAEGFCFALVGAEMNLDSHMQMPVGGYEGREYHGYKVRSGHVQVCTCNLYWTLTTICGVGMYMWLFPSSGLRKLKFR